MAWLAAGPGTAFAGEAKAVLELFTSQGCSSCPPADALLGELTKRDDVVALSLPVDYWDYLGWKDTFAQSAFTDRQRSYARTRGDGQVYTPQIVVNGIAHAVGSRQSEVEAAIESSEKQLAGKRPTLTLALNDGKLSIDVGAAPSGGVGSGRLLLAHIQHSGKVEIARGENGGSEVTYYNVVRKLEPIGPWRGAALSLQVEMPSTADQATDGCVVLLQAGDGGAIVAAAELKTLR